MEVYSKLRRRITEYRNARLEMSVSTHINAVEIALALVEYGVESNRSISKDEERWFKAGWEVLQVLENSEWEDIIDLYHDLGEFAKSKEYFR